MAESMKYMRKQVASVYGPLFVSDKPPRQIAAVYHNMKSRGKFDKKKAKNETEYHQMNIFDYIYETKGDVELWEIR